MQRTAWRGMEGWIFPALLRWYRRGKRSSIIEKRQRLLAFFLGLIGVEKLLKTRRVSLPILLKFQCASFATFVSPLERLVSNLTAECLSLFLELAPPIYAEGVVLHLQVSFLGRRTV